MGEILRLELHLCSAWCRHARLLLLAEETHVGDFLLEEQRCAEQRAIGDTGVESCLTHDGVECLE